MAKVKVPRTPKKSYNPERRPSKLLIDQVKHLEWAALPASQRKPQQLKVYKHVKTEWQAAERIAQLTTLITAAKDALPIRDVALGMLPPVVLPRLPPRKPKRAAAPKATKRKTTKRVEKRRVTKKRVAKKRSARKRAPRKTARKLSRARTSRTKRGTRS